MYGVRFIHNSHPRKTLRHLHFEPRGAAGAKKSFQKRLRSFYLLMHLLQVRKREMQVTADSWAQGVTLEDAFWF